MATRKTSTKIIQVEDSLHQQLLILKASNGFKNLSQTIKHYINKSEEK